LLEVPQLILQSVASAVTTSKTDLGITQEIYSMKLANALNTGLMMASLIVALSACQPKEGPVEKAGREVDEAAERAGEKIEEVGEQLKESAQGED
jgi:hypothetical protein